VRGIRSAEKLVAQVEGDIEDVGGVMKITRIRLHYRFHKTFQPVFFMRNGMVQVEGDIEDVGGMIRPPY
jgi:hypothetical protein